MPFNYIDGVALLILIGYVILGMRTGLWFLLSRLISLVIGFWIAFFFYHSLGSYLNARFSLTPTYGFVGAFLILFIALEEIFSIALRLLLRRFPQIFFENRITRILAIIPALIEGVVLVALLIVSSTALPLPTTITDDVAASYTGTLAAKEAPQALAFINQATGGNVNQALALLTMDSESEGTKLLPEKPSQTSVDEVGEEEMLNLVNQARQTAGAGPLTIDPRLVAIARAHSTDMWNRQYFSHVTPNGLSPFDRMQEANITYLTAGENLALAPTVALAQVGLMNSPGHKANILNPNFHHVGIGIIDGGIYGKMVTQDFTN